VHPGHGLVLNAGPAAADEPGSGVLFGLLIAVPFVDRHPNRWWRRRSVAMGALAVAASGLTVLVAGGLALRILLVIDRNR